ncbi:MAG: signal peptidase I [Opitutales bacterium]|nr:signal peptidase I [Opitutales bacterium]
MFSFLYSDLSKQRKTAKHWLRLADKVIHYRRDLLRKSEVAQLREAAADVRKALRTKVDGAKLRMVMSTLEEALETHGGPYFKRSALAENIEVLLIAAILALGVRTYFLQPFKIPTNSMYPSYSGMMAEVYEEPEEAPGALRGVLPGRTQIRLEAPASGTIQFPVVYNSLAENFSETMWLSQETRGRRFLVFPANMRAYPVLVGGQPVEAVVPADFQPHESLRKALSPEDESFRSWVSRLASEGRVTARDSRVAIVDTGIPVETGETLLAFDIRTGDHLFVDRLSYHFVRPKVGSAVVFRTDNIRLLDQESYYIKRMVGIGGDELEIVEPHLFRNGELLNGRRVWERINTLEGDYPGYENRGFLPAGRSIVIPDDHFFSLGDNSPNSLDGRSYGPVGKSELVGRPLWIYYPFTRRWGLAK